MILARIIAWLESKAPRGVLMILPCVVGFNLYRAAELPLSVGLAAIGCMVILACLYALRLAEDAAVSTAIILYLGALAATLVGDIQVGRVILGGLMLILALSVTAKAQGPWDWALAAGLWSEWLAWLLGNAARGTFGAEVAASAIGQAYGAWAWPAQLLLIALGYAFAARRATTAR